MNNNDTADGGDDDMNSNEDGISSKDDGGGNSSNGQLMLRLHVHTLYPLKHSSPIPSTDEMQENRRQGGLLP